jgi:hypothetical protein
MPPPDSTLLDQLEETPIEKLQDAVKKSEGFSEEDENNHRRGIRKGTRETVAKIKVCFFWFLFALLCLATLLLSAGFLYLLYLWVSSFINDPIAVGKFLEKVVWTGLIVLATLFAEGVIKSDN